MAPRAYNTETRRQQQAELKQRIAAAAAELHAQKGALATSYAEIAARAGVSVPTMYKHFPDLNELVRACSGHVAQQAPAFPVDPILAAPDLASAATTLVEAKDRLNAHFEPWMSWREQDRIPVLVENAERQRQQLTELCAALLQRHIGPGKHDKAAVAWESLLGFDLWHRLVRTHGLSRAAVRAMLIQLLLAVAGPQPASRSSPRPTSRSSK